MYKHECVQCLTEHKLRCIFGFSFFDRLIGNMTYCSEYTYRLKKSKGKVK